MRRERKHVRLRNFDYSSEGAYFITICTKNREHFLGRVMVGTPHVVSQRDSGQPFEMALSEIGKIAFELMTKIPEHFPHVQLDEFIIMPNHIHCILILDKLLNDPIVGVMPAGTRHIVGTRHVVSLQPYQPNTKRINEFSNPIPGSVSVIIQQFKSSVKRWCNKNGHEYFQWQSRFHDHIIRDNVSYERIKNYIINNPANWNEDSFNN